MLYYREAVSWAQVKYSLSRTLPLNNWRRSLTVSQSNVRIEYMQCLCCSCSRLSCLRCHLRRVTTAYSLPLLSPTATGTLSTTTRITSSPIPLLHEVVEVGAQPLYSYAHEMYHRNLTKFSTAVPPATIFIYGYVHYMEPREHAKEVLWTPTREHIWVNVSYMKLTAIPYMYLSYLLSVGCLILEVPWDFQYTWIRGTPFQYGLNPIGVLHSRQFGPLCWHLTVRKQFFSHPQPSLVA